MNTEIQDSIEYLRAFSADTIASLTLAQNYDLKRVAYAIDHILNDDSQNKNELKCKTRGQHEYNYDLFDPNKEYYCIHCGRRADSK